MWLETAIRIILGWVLFSYFWFYISSFFYYIFYIIKVVYSWFYLVFNILWTSSFTLGLLYYMMVYAVIGSMVLLIIRFLK